MSDRLPPPGATDTHALLISGPGEATAAAVSALVRRWLCEGKADEDCRCRSCGTPLDRHPDCLMVQAEGRSIGRDRVLPLATALDARPIWSPHRVAWIADAERMTGEAQNFLLKHLEEPRAHARWVLSSEEPGRLLPTVRSRCQWLRMPPSAPPPASPPGTWFTDRDRLEEDAKAMARWARRAYLESGETRWLELWEACLAAVSAIEHNANRDLWRERLRRLARQLAPGEAVASE